MTRVKRQPAARTSASPSRMRRRPKPRPVLALPAKATSNSSWTFLTNHAHVLICLVTDPTQRLREIALRVGITERAVQKIVAELDAAGILARERVGRRNAYRINARLPLRHPIESHRSIQDLLDMVLHQPSANQRLPR